MGSIWVWWVDKNARLTQKHQDRIQQYQSQGLGVSIISCWEVAKLVELGRLTLSLAVDEWLAAALAYPGVQQLELTIPIIIQSTKLTGFHPDPADQLIVATAKIHRCPVLTADAKILAYPEVQTLK
ncbi:type II toxin-antitoxin system VapC family toxin [Microcoleus sp. LEGE 07076]|uniref:type II toxin-antitoxin system VapC family toxin n=1 Tax=Microcoleus sp. LEGE 07076 TaxID=915322 RepID=UPI001880A504|nr:type II toxin-antitoxin system VapC family toxin [Microcoleus sp. LEGE 07076]MBE9184026.1 type II toxin-antitoxin system VapC family toxin [Microcoleus sp. LEGE 07076]